MFVLGVDHSAPGPDYLAHAEQHLERLAGAGARPPRSRPTELPARPTGSLALRADALVARRHRAGRVTTARGRERTS
jgi:hypothetical protein